MGFQEEIGEEVDSKMEEAGQELTGIGMDSVHIGMDLAKKAAMKVSEKILKSMAALRDKQKAMKQQHNKVAEAKPDTNAEKAEPPKDKKLEQKQDATKNAGKSQPNVKAKKPSIIDGINKHREAQKSKQSPTKSPPVKVKAPSIPGR